MDNYLPEDMKRYISRNDDPFKIVNDDVLGFAALLVFAFIAIFWPWLQ